VARHRSPGSSRHATPDPPEREARTEQGGSARTSHRTPAAHHNAAILVAVAAVIAVTGSMLSLAGALGQPEEPSNTEVNLASDDLALLSPDPIIPPPEESEPDTEPTTEEDGEGEDGEDGDADSDKDSDENAEEAAGESAETRSSRRFSSPAELIDPQNWYLTLPTGSDGDPDTVQPSELDTYDSEYFRLNDSKDGVVFTAHAGGVTTENSKYPRSELREMNGGEKADWDGESGVHTMVLDQAITKTPSTKPDVIAGQIHGGDDDVMQIHLSGSELTVTYADGDKKVVLDDSYRLGERFRVKIQSSDGEVKVWHDGELKASLPISGSGNYFKAGAYVNSNPDKGADSSDVGQVVIYDVEISHS
jgi:hypothetical protein